MNQVHDTKGAPCAPAIPGGLSDLARSGLDVKLHLVQHYAELTRLLAREILDDVPGKLRRQLLHWGVLFVVGVRFAMSVINPAQFSTVPSCRDPAHARPARLPGPAVDTVRRPLAEYDRLFAREVAA